MSLGGVRDEAEIRGHRRTYIGALPGRLVRALRDAGTMNPVILLDEVDKVGADWRGDPSAALLEVLDPAQNHSFRDHYLDVELDLSQVLFLATANVADTIPGPLLDRMEVIRFDGYTSEEKLAIAKGYLWPRQRDRNGLRADEVEDLGRDTATDHRRVHARGRRAKPRARARHGAAQDRDEDRVGSDARLPADEQAKPKADGDDAKALWSREQRQAARCRGEEAGKEEQGSEGREGEAREDRPGDCARCAGPPEVLPGVRRAHGDAGRRHRTGSDRRRRRRVVRRGDRDEERQLRRQRLVLTGQLGDVMKESAKIALSYVRGHAEELGIDEHAFENREFHVHVPAGAIPKDGPSAGVTMVTAWPRCCRGARSSTRSA